MWFRPLWFRDVLCDQFGLDHIVTDRTCPHLSLCGVNSVFLELDHSGSQPFIYKKRNIDRWEKGGRERERDNNYSWR